ncbi:hypothetical protein [Treponema denticola]|nr:hypothetical protein [Treponema denticola]EGC78742.1 bacteriocin-type signal domain-containing protein [Treponema denticola F0402]
MKKFIKLTDEELLKINGGGEINDAIDDEVVLSRKRRINLEKSQDTVREAAIYRPYAKGNFDYEGAAEGVTWCNQSSYDVMEATGVHMKPFYGKPDGYKGKEGQRGAGYWVNANTACKNVENYIDKYAKEWVNAKIKEVGLTNIEAEFDYIGPNSVKNYNEAYTKKYNELYAEGKADCPIQEITAEQAQDLANQGYTVVVMWENTETDDEGNRYSGHISTVRPDLNYDKSKNNLKISNVGGFNEIADVVKGFALDDYPDRTVKCYYDRNQTFRANEGFERYGLAYNDLTGKQSISIHDSTYDENNYINYGKRKAEEDEYIRKLKEERLKELKSSAGFSKSEISQFDGFLFFAPMIMEYAENTASDLNSIDTRAYDLRKVLRNNNTTLLSAIKKGDKNVDDVLLGRITAGDYIEQKKAERAAQEKAEAEAKRIAEEKAEQEKQEKERLEREEEERKKKEASDNSDSGRDSNDSDENTDESIDNDIDDHDDNGEETITTPPENTGDGNQTPPTDGDGENPAPPNEDSSPGNGGGGGNNDGSKPKPPKIPKPGDMIPLSIDTNNEYYLGLLYGTKPFSAQESSAFNSTIISNELSALQPITSLNVAGFPVNDTAIKEDPFGV